MVDETAGDEFDDADDESEYYEDDVYEDDSADDDFEDEYDNEEFDDDGEDEYDDEEFDDEFDEESLEGDAPPKKKKRRTRVRLHCFNCNRPEGFSVANKGRWYHSYFMGLTFGLGSFIGPFKCVCCGHNRLMRYDFLNPRIWFKTKTVDTKHV